MFSNRQYTISMNLGATTPMMPLDTNYQEILKLNTLLDTANIPHTLTRLFDGWKITYFVEEKEISDVVEHFESCGSSFDLMELMGIDFFTGNPDDSETVLRDESALEVFILWSRDFYKRNQKIFRMERYMKAWRQILEENFMFVNPITEERVRVLVGLNRLAQSGCTEIDLDLLSGMELMLTAIIAVVTGDVQQIEMLLSYRTRKHFVCYMIDTLIQCAIDRKQHEISGMLVNFKNENDLYEKNQFLI